MAEGFDGRPRDSGGAPGTPRQCHAASGRGRTRAVRAARDLVRANCPCPICLDPRNGQRLVSITDLPRQVFVTAAGRSGDRVEIVFGPDGHRATFDVGWLSQFASEDDNADGGSSVGALDGEDARTEDAKRLWSA